MYQRTFLLYLEMGGVKIFVIETFDNSTKRLKVLADCFQKYQRKFDMIKYLFWICS